MALRTYSLSLGRLKNDFCEGDEAIYQGVRRPREIIICILGIENATFTKSFKYDLSRRMVRRTQHLYSGRLKKRLW
jgi:hypothetical protein